MACTITLGRALDCKDALGGLSRIFFVSDFADGLVTAAGTGDGTAGSATVATASGESFTVTDLPAMTVLQYDLRPDLSSFTVNVQSDPATGASLFEQTLNVVLQKHQEQDPEQLRLISRNRSQIFVLDNNDNVFLFGATYGMDLNGGTLTSGAAHPRRGVPLTRSRRGRRHPLCRYRNGWIFDGYPTQRTGRLRSCGGVLFGRQQGLLLTLSRLYRSWLISVR